MPAANVTHTPARKTTSPDRRNDGPYEDNTFGPYAERLPQEGVADGRAMSATVNNYLIAIATPRKRGQKVTMATLERRLAEARSRVNIVTGVEKVVAAQAVRDLLKKLSQPKAANGIDAVSLEAAFVKIAKTFSENRGISYAVWRDAGVPAAVTPGMAAIRNESRDRVGGHVSGRVGRPRGRPPRRTWGSRDPRFDSCRGRATALGQSRDAVQPLRSG
jgi:hypothetical protein